MTKCDTVIASSPHDKPIADDRDLTVLGNNRRKKLGKSILYHY